jgi:hypothetical protein
VHDNPQLAMIAFGVGIAALLWVFRRTLLRARLLNHDPDEQSYALRKRSAGLAIDDISAREWLQTYRRALLIPRAGNGLTPDQQAQLASISRWQQEHARRGT